VTHRRTCRTCGWTGTYTSAAKANYAKRRHSCARHLAKAASRARREQKMAAVDRTPKPCHHKNTQHQHGTYACYTLDGCRCLPCADATTVYERTRTRRNAYGRSNLVDAEPVRQHVRTLMSAGMGLKQINAVAGIHGGVMAKLMYGFTRADGTCRPPARRVRRETAARVLAVQLQLADGARVPSGDTARRLQSLVALGWPACELARRLGINPTNFTDLLHGRRETTAGRARAVHALYVELVDQDPPAATSTRARRFAAANEWAPPLRIGGRPWIGEPLPTSDRADAVVNVIGDRGPRYLPYAPLGAYLASITDWRLRVDERTEKAIDRARKDGRLTHGAGDGIATTFGLHLDLIWTPADREEAS
jgi:hypothetical protein